MPEILHKRPVLVWPSSQTTANMRTPDRGLRRCCLTYNCISIFQKSLTSLYQGRWQSLNLEYQPRKGWGAGCNFFLKRYICFCSGALILLITNNILFLSYQKKNLTRKTPNKSVSCECLWSNLEFWPKVWKWICPPKNFSPTPPPLPFRTKWSSCLLYLRSIRQY